MKKVFRNVFQLEVLSEDEIVGMPLGAILEECDTGHFIGNSSHVITNEVLLSNEEVVEKLISMGNDGCFFDEEDYLD